MYIQSEKTPNPNTMKFIPGISILGKKDSVSFDKDSEDSLNSNLAVQIFKIDGIKSIFLTDEFISITKLDEVNWDDIKVHILTTLVDYFASGQPVIEKIDNKSFKEEDISEVRKKIIDLIEEKVRPAVAQDGGDIVFKDFEDGVVYLELYGACQGCPSAAITLKNGIENMLKYYVPEVQSVESI